MLQFLVVFMGALLLCSGGEVNVGNSPPCPENSIQAYFPTNNCSYFWQCSNRVAVLQQCAPGTEWEQSLWSCVHIGQSNCTRKKWSTSKEPPVTNTPTGVSTSSTDRPPKTKITTTQISTQNDCETEPDTIITEPSIRKTRKPRNITTVQ
ncbi:hypothetical protein ABEB36_014840 [Hypothenemus hampei]|uniref:Chitin-binding type-2 domain-containing protein n=1 Tax=Hypothenemus hampei TaxID=57062 RepID=A0ABD1E107_HYPHA